MSTTTEVLATAEERMKKTIALLQKEFHTVRTGRANPALLDRVEVEYYGTPTPLKSLANISTPDGRSLLIQPYDKGVLKDIEQGIHKSGLGLTPNNDGTVIRINIPTPTEERRKEMSKHVHKLAEEGRNTVRGVRRDANERLKKLLKDSKISEDDERKGLDEVQRITDGHIKLIDDAQKKKDGELLGK